MASQFQTGNKTDIANTASITMTKPTGVVDGDLMITIICSGGTAAPSSVPSGWTLIRSNDSGGSGVQTSIHSYYKVASSEGASYAWTAAATPSGGMILRFTGQASSPIDNSSGAGGQGANAFQNDISSGSTMTPTRVNQAILMAAIVYNDAGGSPTLSDWKIVTDNPSWTGLYDQSFSSTGVYTMGCAYALRPAATATGAPTFDYNVLIGERYAAQTIFISNLNSQTFTETVTCTDTHINNAGFNLTVVESITPTDTHTLERLKSWDTLDKSSTTWVTQDKT